MKIAITGGHLTPALALIDYVQTHQPQDELVFIGRLYSQQKLKQKAVEKKEVERKGVRFIPLKAVKWGHENLLTKFFIKPWQFLTSIARAVKVLKNTKPDVLISFGGYLAVPAAIAAKLLGIKVVTHEGTRALSWSNQTILKLAAALAVSYPEVKEQTNHKKVVVTGTPIRAELKSRVETAPTWIQTDQLDKPLLLIMGGNQGSKVINQTAASSLPQLLSEWSVVHICGRSNTRDNYQKQLAAAAAKLPKEFQARYWVRPWVGAKDLAWLYQHAFGAVSRAGANTTEELARAKIPAVFIPLPHAHLQEQLKNAQWLVSNEAALLLPESKLSPKTLKKSLDELKNTHSRFKKNLGKLKLESQGAKNLYQLAASVVK